MTNPAKPPDRVSGTSLMKLVSHIPAERRWRRPADALIIIGRQLEIMAQEQGVESHVSLGTLRFSLFQLHQGRIAQLAPHCRSVTVYGEADVEPPHIPNVTFVPVPAGTPLSQEWFFVVDSPVFWAAMVTQAITERGTEKVRRYQFEGVLTTDERMVSRASLLLNLARGETSLEKVQRNPVANYAHWAWVAYALGTHPEAQRLDLVNCLADLPEMQALLAEPELEYDQVVARAMEALREHCGAVSAMLLRDAGGVVVPVSWSANSAPPPARSTEEGLVGQALQQGHLILQPLVSSDPEYGMLGRAGAAVAIPISVRGAAWGVLLVGLAEPDALDSPAVARTVGLATLLEKKVEAASPVMAESAADPFAEFASDDAEPFTPVTPTEAFVEDLPSFEAPPSQSAPAAPPPPAQEPTFAMPPWMASGASSAPGAPPPQAAPPRPPSAPPPPQAAPPRPPSAPPPQAAPPPPQAAPPPQAQAGGQGFNAPPGMYNSPFGAAQPAAQPPPAQQPSAPTFGLPPWLRMGAGGAATPQAESQPIPPSKAPVPVQPAGLPVATGRSFPMLQKRMMSALVAFDVNNAEEIWKEASALYPSESLCTELLMPVQVAIGEGWHRGEVSVAAEHFASRFVEGKLHNLLNMQLNQPTGPLAVVGCAQAEMHELGALMVALFLKWAGFRVIYLGQNVPNSTLESLVRQVRPQILGFSATTIEAAHNLVETGQILSRIEPPRPMFIFGGMAFYERPDLRMRVQGGNFIEGDFRATARQLAAQFLR